MRCLAYAVRCGSPSISPKARCVAYTARQGKAWLHTARVLISGYGYGARSSLRSACQRPCARVHPPPRACTRFPLRPRSPPTHRPLTTHSPRRLPAGAAVRAAGRARGLRLRRQVKTRPTNGRGQGQGPLTGLPVCCNGRRLRWRSFATHAHALTGRRPRPPPSDGNAAPAGEQPLTLTTDRTHH